ncbi:MAG: ATP-binding protein [Jatrophihabitans sp.]
MGSLLVRHDPASAGVVRREVAADLTAHEITPDSVDDVVLVISELVGNAVTHAIDDGDLDVAWELEDATVIVRVYDSCPGQPTPRQATPTATSGRGLAIVEALAQEWGVHTAGHGKQVWARVPIRHAI